MEKKRKIKLDPVIRYDLPLDELKTMYIYLALSRYASLREVDYNDGVLLKLLRSDINSFLTETKSLMQQNPNNHILHKMVTFFDFHSHSLKQIKEELDKSSE